MSPTEEMEKLARGDRETVVRIMNSWLHDPIDLGVKALADARAAGYRAGLESAAKEAEAQAPKWVPNSSAAYIACAIRALIGGGGG